MTVHLCSMRATEETFLDLFSQSSSLQKLKHEYSTTYQLKYRSVIKWDGLETVPTDWEKDPGNSKLAKVSEKLCLY